MRLVIVISRLPSDTGPKVARRAVVNATAVSFTRGEWRQDRCFDCTYLFQPRMFMALSSVGRYTTHYLRMYDHCNYLVYVMSTTFFYDHILVLSDSAETVEVHGRQLESESTFEPAPKV